MLKRLIAFIIVLVGLICIVQISRSIFNLWQKGDLISEQAAILKQKQAENDQLKQKLNQVESPEFIEKEARDKLNLQKEGEVVVVLPKTQELVLDDQNKGEKLANWQKWWKLIIN